MPPQPIHHRAAKRVVLDKPPEEALNDTNLFLAHVMTYGTLEDIAVAMGAPLTSCGTRQRKRKMPTCRHDCRYLGICGSFFPCDRVDKMRVSRD